MYVHSAVTLIGPRESLQGQWKERVMGRVLLAALAASAIGFASPVLAAVDVTTTTTTGTPLQDAIHASTTNTTDNAVQVYGSTTQGGASANVLFTGGNTLLTSESSATSVGSTTGSDLAITNGGGFAALTDSPLDGTLNLYSVIINPDQLFTDLKLSIQLASSGTFQIYYMLTGTSSFVLDPGIFTTNNKGNTNYLVDVTGGTFDAIQVVSSGSSIFELKQMSINNVGAVPEPATWAMMLLGFGAMGASLRRSRRRSGKMLQIA